MYNFWRTNFRALWKNKLHSSVNLLGLTLGIVSTLVIVLTIHFELSFDRYHADADRIYRIVTEKQEHGQTGFTAGITYPLPEAIRNDFPELAGVTIVDANETPPVFGIVDKDGSKKLFQETKAAYADPDYFSIFTYHWIAGNPADALTREKTVVLTQSEARKLFGDEPALNQVISCNNQFDLTVSGVVQDPPLNTDLPFTVIISNRLGANKHGWDNWGSTSASLNCYVKLPENVNQADLERRMKTWHLKYFSGDAKETGESRFYFLQRLSDVHFDTRFQNFNNRTVSSAKLLTLSLIGFLLFATGCINFINLNTVLIMSRAKEAGVRKVLGGLRKDIVLQFLGETFLITVLATVVCAGVIDLVLASLSPVLGFKLRFEPVADPVTGLFLLAIPFVITLAAGLYPAMALASYKPIDALKSKLTGHAHQGLSLRRTLIGVQLVISQTLVIATIIIARQLDFFANQPMGLDTTAVIEFAIPEREKINLRDLLGRIDAIPGVESSTMSNTGATSSNKWGGDFDATVNGKKVTAETGVKFIAPDFLKTYRLKLVAGEDLAASDSVTGFIVNEAFARAMGVSAQDAVGVPVAMWGRNAMISGVIADYHSESLHQAIAPLIMMTGIEVSFVGAVKLQTADVKTAMQGVEKAWKQTFPNYVFEYVFLDDTIRQFYDAERKTSSLISIFSVVAILIGSIGLLGLVSFMAARRTKEVGIRKTLGASVASIMTLFSKEFLYLIGIAFLIAAPVSYYFMKEWLANFAYRIEPGVLPYLAGVFVIMTVVLVTVGVVSYRAASANPIKALRDE
jgi:ABC-type antimicrobial peptide transport system permease subunit